MRNEHNVTQSNGIESVIDFMAFKTRRQPCEQAQISAADADYNEVILLHPSNRNEFYYGDDTDPPSAA